MGREGSYPPPPHWPDRLTGNDMRPPFTWAMVMIETDEVRHTYLADGWPGPCWTEWDGDGQFLAWWPALTIERAERAAGQ